MIRLRTAALAFVEHSVPPARAIYRRWRDRRWLRHPYQLEGFKLYGHPAVQSFEWSDRNTFERLLRSADVFVDVGANIGLYTCLARSRGKSVIAIEPLPRNLMFLYRNLDLNGFRDVEVLPVAAGATPSVRMIYGFAEIASFLPDWGRGAAAQSEPVTVSTLDRLLSSQAANKSLFVKIDVEGFEFNVLKGAATLLQSARVVWMVEILARNDMTGRVNPDFHETFRMFARYGYQALHADTLAAVDGANVGLGKNFIFSRAGLIAQPHY